MAEKKSKILDKIQIAQKIDRMAYQIIENNFDEKELILIGLRVQGFFLAERLKKVLNKITKAKVLVYAMELDKESPNEASIKFDFDVKCLENKVVVLVDDVANSGKVLTYSLIPLLKVFPKKIQAAVLVDRKHKSFPVTTDYVGLSLATTMQKHITVEIGGKGEDAVYLS